MIVLPETYFCARCVQIMEEEKVASPVLVQLTVNGPLHFWQRFDYASKYFHDYVTLCGRNVLPK